MAKDLRISDLIRLQLSSIEQLDSETISRLEPVLERAREHLVAELNKYGRDTFSWKQKNQTYHLVTQALIAINMQNIETLKEESLKYNELGVDLANKEIKTLSKEVGISIPNIKRDKIALNQNQFLLNNMETSMTNYSAEIRAQISRFITDATIQRKSGYETVSRAGRYINIKLWKIRRIIRTEMSKILNETKLMTYQEFNKDNFKGKLMKRMYHPMDNRTAEDSKQWAKADPAIPLSEPFRLKLKNGDIQEGNVPPLRPNDRAVLMPFHSYWRDAK